jgi:hypothetical protein
LQVALLCWPNKQWSLKLFGGLKGLQGAMLKLETQIPQSK